jgi:ribosomal protein S18 acetylase RimI-like enzyme
MEFRKATENDIEEICLMVKKAITVMNQNGIPQWDEIYPTKEEFLDDICGSHLYKGIIDNQIAVIYVLNKWQDEAYSFANWSYTGDDFCVLHRLCVNTNFQNQGVAKKTLAHLEKQLRNTGTKAIRLDVFTENPYALKLYEKAGYHKTGTADWRKGKFLLMEKIL